MSTANEVLERLREGNRRFVAGTPDSTALASVARRGELLKDQKPRAIILGCSDSRVPAEMVFDQGLGDLFVIRVAGNIVAPSQIGSVEFAAAMYGTPLVVVLGHSWCGAVLATLDELTRRTQHRSENLRSIVDRVKPSVQSLMAADPDQTYDNLLDKAVKANVRASVERLRHGSEILERLIRQDQLLIVGAEYSLETGVVEFFDETVNGD